MKTKWLGTMGMVAIVGLATSVKAIPTLELSDGADTIIFNGAVVSSSGTIVGSGLAGPGTVTWFGQVGAWNTTVTIGETLNGGSFPSIDLAFSSAIASALGSPLTVIYSDNNFGPTVGGVFLATTGGTVNGATLVTTASIGNNTIFDTSGGALVNGSVINNAGSYDLVLKDVLTASTAGVQDVSSLDTRLSVPDGGTTVLLLGAALSGLGLLRKKLTA